MKIGDIIELEITDNGMNGEGIARLDGTVIFVPHTLVGERVRAVVKEVKKNFARAKVIKLLSASPDRVEPKCDCYYRCGGCDLLHVSTERERTIKINELKNNLSKIGGISVSEVNYIDSDTDTDYRNKVQVPFGYHDGAIVTGYYEPKSHKVVPMTKCCLNGAWASEIIRNFVKFANENMLSVYDEKTGVGLLRHIVLRRINHQISVVIVINGTKIENIKKFELPNNCSLFYSVNTRRTNVIMGDRLMHMSGNRTLSGEILGVKFELSPESFMQINDNVRDKLYMSALEAIGDADVCIDLYSGIGITANLLAKKCNKIYSIEIVPSAVANARKTAEINQNTSKIDTICGDTAIQLPKLVDKLRTENGASMPNFTVLIDPPRKGCDASVLDAIIAVRPAKIVYISCNHATQSRDIKHILTATDNAYTTSTPTLFNMFPNTSHVESLITLTLL